MREAQPPGSRAPLAPKTAHQVFGDRLPKAEAYAELLAGAAIERGLVGPREALKLWDRHIVSSAVVSELIENGASVADVGSGAGLPGIPLAIARPDIDLVLIEPMLRRTTFLVEAVEALELERVTVHRGRAEDVAASNDFDVVTARAVAPLNRLVTLTFPLIRRGGKLLAVKGQSVSEELRDAAASLARMGAASWTVEEAGVGLIDPPTRVAVVLRDERAGPPGRSMG